MKHEEHKALDAPYGVERMVITPQGKNERCIVFKMSSQSGKEEYATIYKPKSNLGVRYSVFKIK